jgi:hypothetical protein
MQDQPERRPHERLAQHVADLVDLLDPRGAECILEALLRARVELRESRRDQRARPREAGLSLGLERQVAGLAPLGDRFVALPDSEDRDH